MSVCLGWSMLVLPCFGNAHEEAWEILSRVSQGLQFRSRRGLEVFSAFSRTLSWYELVVRTAEKQCLVHRSLWNEEFVSARLKKGEAFDASQGGSSTVLVGLEVGRTEYI